MLSIPEKNEPVQFTHGWELLLPTHPPLTRAQELYREADETWKRGTKLADTDPDAAKECYESARLLEAAALQEETCTCSERSGLACPICVEFAQRVSEEGLA